MNRAHSLVRADSGSLGIPPKVERTAEGDFYIE